MLSKKPKIVVVGAGFAGLRAIKQLARADAEIILIDRNNYHTFIPLLYQVASGFIPPEAITYPLRKYLRSIPNARFIQARVEEIDRKSKIVKTDILDLEYDYLVIATGSQSKFLGVEGAALIRRPIVFDPNFSSDLNGLLLLGQIYFWLFGHTVLTVVFSYR
ncbi:MAG: FAD-dependent oxidoreductase [Pleurocapsa sp. MO_226.B13]|nr:FAD-dependent oxidoreductase [Pleurocapsa sp. MO_226.B13]